MWIYSFTPFIFSTLSTWPEYGAYPKAGIQHGWNASPSQGTHSCEGCVRKLENPCGTPYGYWEDIHIHKDSRSESNAGAVTHQRAAQKGYSVPLKRFKVYNRTTITIIKYVNLMTH